LPNSAKQQKKGHMIQVVVSFWTDQIADKEGQTKPKNCWDYGYVTLPRNVTHGISFLQEHFKKPSEILPTIEDLFKKQSIKMWHGSTKKIYAD
jgi:hypothetical protein